MKDFDSYKAPYVKASETSHWAAQSVEEAAASWCMAILKAIKGEQGHGLTCDEIEQAFGLLHQTASARVRDLSARGYIVDSHWRRPTRTGRWAVVWVDPADPGPMPPADPPWAKKKKKKAEAGAGTVIG